MAINLKLLDQPVKVIYPPATHLHRLAVQPSQSGIVEQIMRYNASQMKDSAPDTNTPIEPDPVIEAYKKDIDRSLIRENLRLTVDQRFKQLTELQRFAEELQNAGRKARQRP